MPRLFLAALLLVLVAGCRDWRSRVVPALAAAEPEQVLLSGEQDIELEAKGHRVTLTPRAAYRITGYAVDTSRALLDEWDFVLPMDLALVWEPVATQSRDDIGSGACEQMWVEEVEVDRP